jgi:hypothetical protein
LGEERLPVRALQATRPRTAGCPVRAARSRDATIDRRFKRYGEWAGLTFWLYLTRAWVEVGLPV